MNIARFAILLLLPYVPLLPGCGAAGDSSPSDVGGDTTREDGSTRAVEFDEDGPVTLVYRESRAFALAVLDDTGPLAGVRVDLGLEGDAQDSSLRETVLTTDDDGRTTGTLVAGTVSASFSLRATLSTGETARLAVQTSPPNEVRVTLEPLYDGARNVPEYEVRLLRGGGCPAVYPGPADPTEETILTVNAADPTFTLDRGLLFAELRVLAAGRDAGATLTWGCVDGVTVPTAGIGRLSIVLADLPWPCPGRHEIEVDLSLATLAVGVVDEAFDPFGPLLAGECGDGEFVVDGLIEALRAAGNTAVAEVFEARRLADDLDDAVDLAVTGLGESLAGVHDRAAAFFRAATFAGDVELGETDGTGNGEAVERWRTIGDGTTALPLATDGEPAVEGVVRTTFASDHIALDSHDLPLSLGRVVDLVLSHAAEGTAPAWGTRFADWLGAELSCTAVVAALTASADLVAVCDPACLLALCEGWRADLAAASAAAVTAAESSFHTIEAASSCAFLDADGRLPASGRCDGAIEVHWRGFTDVTLAGTWAVVPEPLP
ncbi:MAG: hypothetical protein JXB32_20015 [Deltaproteobacteria bacterium]|nr:hypothetical protein [Deltaproteobacteria bacterium]